MLSFNVRLHIWFFVLLISVDIFADILFIDVNDSPKEITSAKKAAEKRGEKLIVIPSSEQIKSDPSITKIRNEIARLETARSKCKNNCDDLDDKIYEQKELYNTQLKNKKLYLDSEGINYHLNQLKKKNVTITSVIVSGHDGNGEFFGLNGSFTETDFSEAIHDNAPIGDSIRSLMLWGCYATNISGAFNLWKDSAPNIEMIAGFNEIAPSNIRQSSFDYLEDVLVKEKQLTAEKDAKALQKAFLNLKSVTQMKSALCVRDNYVTPNRANSLKELKNMCTPPEKLSAITKKYNCYIKGLEGCTDIPTDTRNGEIRKFYNQLQDVSHCDLVDPHFSLDASALLRLVFFNTVRDNFSSSYGQELDRFDNDLKLAGIPNSLLLNRFNKDNRSTVIKKITDLSKYLNSKKSIAKSNTPEFKKLDRLDTALGVIRNAIGELNPDYIYSGFIDPGSTDISGWFTEHIDNALSGRPVKWD